MKYIPSSVTRATSRALLKAQKNSPKYLFIAGVAGMVGTTVLACKATLRVEDEVLIPAERAIERARGMHDQQRVQYTDKDFNTDVTRVYIEAAGKMVKLYGPSVIVGVLSIAALTKSHNILSQRNAALGAAYATLDKAFQAYRARVVEEFGPQKDQELRHGVEEREIVSYDKKGNPKIEPTRHAGSGDVSGYAMFFDESNPNWEPNKHRNMAFIGSVQSWANSRLIKKGHLFLNEVLDELGFEHTTEGAVVGWIYDYDGREGSDGYVDFSIFDSAGNHRPFFDVGNGSILLDFNVDGPIYMEI